MSQKIIKKKLKIRLISMERNNKKSRRYKKSHQKVVEMKIIGNKNVPTSC